MSKMSRMLSKMNLISVVQQLPSEDIETIQGYVEMIENENEELKKQLEDKILSEMKLENELFNKRKEYQETYKDVRIEIKEYKNQQKEFINYLEDEIKRLEENNIYEPLQRMAVETHKHNLSKYKEIIGDVKDEQN